jgi:hypothetical protein
MFAVLMIGMIDESFRAGRQMWPLSLRAIRAFTPVFDGLWRSNPAPGASRPWIASSLSLLAMTA